jgi:hypothetical protein
MGICPSMSIRLKARNENGMNTLLLEVWTYSHFNITEEPAPTEKLEAAKQ